jgi:all-trans-retinol dehydrogenase (NAD+)
LNLHYIFRKFICFPHYFVDPLQKFGAVGLDESLRVELRQSGKTGVKTTCICPYYINTGMFDGAKTRIPILMPILNEDWASTQIVNAVLQNDEFLMLPRIARIMFALRLFPVPIQDFVLDILGMHDSMSDFKGRTPQVERKN